MKMSNKVSEAIKRDMETIYRDEIEEMKANGDIFIDNEDETEEEVQEKLNIKRIINEFVLLNKRL